VRRYTFDCKLFAALTVQANSLEEARTELRGALDCASIHCGADRQGKPIMGEASVDGELEHIETNGEPV